MILTLTFETSFVSCRMLLPLNLEVSFPLMACSFMEVLEPELLDPFFSYFIWSRVFLSVPYLTVANLA